MSADSDPVLETEKIQELPQLVCVEPAQIPIEGILTARGLSRTNLKTKETPSGFAAS
jgi:hypothetical protein